MPTPSEENAGAEHLELAQSCAKYADLIAGFVIAQSLLFVYSLVQVERLQGEIFKSKWLIFWSVSFANVFYFVFILLLYRREKQFRSKVNPERKNEQDKLSLRTGRDFAIGRAVLMFLSTSGCLAIIGGMEKPSTPPTPATQRISAVDQNAKPVTP